MYHGAPAQPVNRILVTCEPFEGENSMHLYRPPFGLHSYDPRFSANWLHYGLRTECILECG